MCLSVIKKQYDQFANEYYHDFDSSMQFQNLKNLFNYLVQIKPDVSNKKWLDAGCGPGSLSKLKNEFFPKSVMGIDISKEMIQIAQKTNFYDCCRVGSLTHLKDLQNQNYDIYFSNTVFHWLNFEGNGFFKKSLQEAYRVLKPKGLIALSLSGLGTAHQFIDAYQKTTNQTKDVLGSENLFKVVDLFEECGFYVELAKLEFEPVQFNHPLEYVEAVEKYGKEIYLASFQHLPKDERDQIFKKIGETFIQTIGNQKYRHKQYMIYIIGKKL
ncbi:methyltransferase domain-containing protein [Nanoarchaeota archaeon]